MDIDREDLVQSLGGEAAVAKMNHEARADALEDFQIAKLDAEVAALRQTKKWPSVADHESLIDTRGHRRGIGKLFRQSKHQGRHEDSNAPPTVGRLPKMPEKPILFDFFKYRFAPGTHLLQSAALAKRKGESEEVILACLLHDIGGTLMKADHGYWGAQLIEPYVSEKVTFAVRYHQALRFFPDSSVGYEYPIRYYEAFGIDYVPRRTFRPLTNIRKVINGTRRRGSSPPTTSMRSIRTSRSTSKNFATSLAGTSGSLKEDSASTTRRSPICGGR